MLGSLTCRHPSDNRRRRGSPSFWSERAVLARFPRVEPSRGGRAVSTALAKRGSLPAMTEHRIGFVGAGNMAAALLEGILRAQTVAPAQIQISDIDAAKSRAAAQ